MSAEAERREVEELSRRFRPALMAFFLRRIRNHAEAEDLTQDVLLRVAACGSVIDATRPHGYVFQMAANLLRDRARKGAVRARFASGLGAIDASENEGLDPHRVLQGRESLATVLAAMKELPERTRSIFILFRLEHMRQREIADLYGLSTRAIEKHIVKASLHLRLRLGEDR